MRRKIEVKLTCVTIQGAPENLEFVPSNLCMYVCIYTIHIINGCNNIHTYVATTYYITNRACVVVSPGSVTIPHTTMGLSMKSKSFQLIPSLQLYLYNVRTYVATCQRNNIFTYVHSYYVATKLKMQWLSTLAHRWQNAPLKISTYVHQPKFKIILHLIHTYIVI